MHDEVKRFSLQGELGEPNIVETKERLVHHVENLMREYGYVPVLDLEPHFTLDYNTDKKSFDFTLSVYGVHVDKERVWEIGGMMSGKEIPKYTPQPKLKQSLLSVD